MIDIDKESIREQVESRTINLNVTEEWFTPAGNRRSAPMYEAEIRNKYLGKSKRIKKRSLREIEQAANNQLAKWADQEIRARVKDAKNDAKEKAEATWKEMKASLEERLQELGDILQATVHVDDRIDWEELMDYAPFHDFDFSQPKPRPPDEPPRPPEPKPNAIEFLLPFLFRKKEEQHVRTIARWKQARNELAEEYNRQLREWSDAKNAARAKWENRKAAYEEGQRERNQRVVDFRERYEAAQPEAVVEYIERVFERSEYPEGFEVGHDVGYEAETNTLLVDLSLPSMEAIPAERDYRLKKTTGEITPVEMKQKDRESLFDSALEQTVIRTIHEVYET